MLYLQKKKIFNTVGKNHRLYYTTALVLMILIFHHQLTCFIVAWRHPELYANYEFFKSSTYWQYHNALIYGGVGVFFYELFLYLEKRLLGGSSFGNVQKYGYLAAKMLQWAVVIVFWDLIYQNLRYGVTSFFDFSMSYSAIGGLVGLEICIFRNFLGTYCKG